MKNAMPIRAAPFAHQVEAYEFALRLFGIADDDETDTQCEADTKREGDEICQKSSNGQEVSHF